MSAASADWQRSVATAQPAPALGRHVLDHLRRLIILGELAAGTHLVESQLSETFEVSRGPVRDALRQLEIEGLVESRRRGVFVIGLTPDDIDELYQLRHILEAHAVRLCMGGEPTTLARVRPIVDRMKRAAEQADSAAFAEADLDFHSAFYTFSGNRRLDSVWQQYRPTFADMLTLTNAEDRDLSPTYSDHVDLLDAITAGNERQALRLLHDHIEGSRRRMLTAYTRLVNDRTAAS